MNENDLQRRKKRLSMAIKVCLAMLTCIVVSPVIFLAVKGLIGLIVAAVIGLAAVNFAPVVGDKFANWRLKALKAEAAKNPIETLQTDYVDKQAALVRSKDNINSFSSSVENFAGKLDGFKAQFPKDAPKFDAQLATMRKLLEFRKQRYTEAKLALAQYESEIARAEAIWKMALEAQKMNAAAGMSEGDFLQKIKVETAIDSVTNSMNTAFAELETSLIDEQVSKEIEAKKEHLQLEAASVPIQVGRGDPITEKGKVRK